MEAGRAEEFLAQEEARAISYVGRTEYEQYVAALTRLQHRLMASRDRPIEKKRARNQA